MLLTFYCAVGTIFLINHGRYYYGKVNKKYKDSVFSLYFNNKKRLIELINAIEGTDYPEDTEIEINTLDEALFKDRKNDISFIINGELIVLVEHQSSLNENMPLRIFVYIARIYERIVELKNIYGTRMIKIPTPRFIVLYNGTGDCENHKVLKLSDAFIAEEEEPSLELKVDMYNINYGKSEVLRKSRSLEEYSTFIHYVRQEQTENGKPLDEAIKTAIDRAVKDGVMKEFLQYYGSEVRNMLFEEWDWEKYGAVQRQEGLEEGLEKGRKEGHKEGRKEGRMEGIVIGKESALKSAIRAIADLFSPEEIARRFNVPTDFVLSALNNA